MTTFTGLSVSAGDGLYIIQLPGVTHETLQSVTAVGCFLVSSFSLAAATNSRQMLPIAMAIPTIQILGGINYRMCNTV